MIDQSDLRAPISIAEQASVAEADRAAAFLDASDSEVCQEMLAVGGIDLPEFESLDALPAAIVAEKVGAEAFDTLSDDPDQVWFDETVTTMFMEDADRPKIVTAAVEPRMETTAWPLAAVVSIDEASLERGEEADNAEAETAARLRTQDEILSAPTPAIFLSTAKREVVVESVDETTLVPMKPEPVDDVPAPARDLRSAAILDKKPIDESGKRGFGVKLAPGWKPLRGQKLDSRSKANAVSSGADNDSNNDSDAAFGAEQELVAATLRTPRQDSILDGFGQFLQEQVILSAAIDGPDFKALASSFDGKDADSDSSATETAWISGASTDGDVSKSGPAQSFEAPDGESQEDFDRDLVVGDDFNQENSALEVDQKVAPIPDQGDEPVANSSFSAENADEADLTAELPMEGRKGSTSVTVREALPKSSLPILAPSRVVDDQPSGFSAPLLYSAEPAGSFFDDLKDDSTSTDEEVVEKAEGSQATGQAVAPAASSEMPVNALGSAYSRANPALFRHGVTCPSCEVKLQIQARYLDIEGKCPGCSEMIVARQIGMGEPIVELATGRFPSFDRQPNLEPCDVSGGTVLSEGASVEKVSRKSIVTPMHIAESEILSSGPIPPFDPFSNPNNAFKKNREAAVGGVWGPASGKGIS